MNICFMARSSYNKASIELYNCIKRNFCPEIKGVFITMNSKESDRVKKVVPKAKVYEVSDYFKKHWKEFTLDRLIEYEANYCTSPVWSYIYTDRFLINCDYEYAIKTTVGFFDLFEHIYSENNIDFYYSENVSTLPCYISFLVGSKLGIKYVTQIAAYGLDSTHHFFGNNQFLSNVDLRDFGKGQTYSEEERTQAESFLLNFESNDIKPTYMIKYGQSPKLKPSYIALPFIRLVSSFSPSNRDVYSYMYYKRHKSITKPIEFYWRYKLSKKYYTTPDYSKKYVFFPLHYQPEATTIVAAPKYEKQLFWIDSWAKSLPADTIMYVKEHSSKLGSRPLTFYKELRKYPNVILVDPFENSRKLIENAYVVTTLTGTAGWEAMLLRKPVIIGGSVFYSNAPGVMKVNDIYQNYVDVMNKWVKPSRDEIIEYLCAYFKTLHKGNIVALSSSEQYDEDNLKDISKSLYEYLSKNNSKRKVIHRD